MLGHTGKYVRTHREYLLQRELNTCSENIYNTILVYDLVVS